MSVFTPEVRQYLNARRSFDCPVRIDHVEQRSAGGLELRGHAAVFESDSEPIWGMFIERIARGAFRKALGNKPDVRFLFNHDGQPMARTANGTLTLREDETGLAFEANIADTTLGRDVYLLVERGDVDQMSFAFTVEADRWQYADEAGLDLRTILEIRDLFEISVVPFPAYRTTDVATSPQAPASDDERGADTDSQQAAQGDVAQQGERGESETDVPTERTNAVDEERARRARQIQILRSRHPDGSTSRTTRAAARGDGADQRR